MPSEHTQIFFRARVAMLLAILAAVALWAWRDVRSRRERNTWARPLSVAIVLVRRGPLEASAIAAFRNRIPALGTRLADEFHRYRPRAMHPFAFTFIGPVDSADSPPKAASDSFLDAAKNSWSLWRWTSRIDRAAGLDTSAYDSRVYVAARPPATQESEMVEGESEDGGRVATVGVELDVSMADFALFVTAHELLHTLGASDKYDSAGRTLVPAGLAEPDRVPRLPQFFAEVMARNRPVAPGRERPPDGLDQLAVGPATAAEIGWRESAR
jgi:hypothetical protein